MPELSITVESADTVLYAAAPMLAFKLRVTNANPAELVHTVVLRSQIQIEVARRRYSGDEQKLLADLFGQPERWGQTLRSLLWTNTSTVIPQFTGSTTVALQLPCSFDFTIATTKYFDGLADGEIPVLLMFSGTVFYADETGSMAVAPIAWEKETRFRLPLKVWKNMMDSYYPNSAWLCLRRDVFGELQSFKTGRGIPTWEETFETLLAAMKEEAIP